MTITNRIKHELFNADIDYQYALDNFKAEYPHGISYLGETVSTKAASLYGRLEKASAAYSALAMLTTPKFERSYMEAETRRLVEKYNAAETLEDMESTEKEYYALYTMRS